MDIKEELKKTKDRVRQVLKEYPETKEGDPLMTILYVWRDYDDLPDWIVQVILDHKSRLGLSSLETIRRMRQKLQNEEDPSNLGPSEDTAEQRAQREQDIRENINNEDI